MDNVKQGGEELHRVPEKPKSDLAAREEAVLAFWNEQEIFKKSLEKPAPKGEFVFYDGPPFANGLPHYGHILASAIKDAIPRYRTMQGYRVPRRWGWDCHGLPVENLVEKELGFKTKRDIEEFGIAKFNAAARTSIMKDVADWKRIIPRMGRWADMENDYKTMDASYTESVWWAFKNLYDKKLIYEGFKAMHLCPRCGTTLSNFEVAQGYQDIQDISVMVKFPLVDEPETSLLIWTTTPWTLPGNSAAAVNAQATYVKVRTDEGFVVVAKDLAKKIFGEGVKIFGEMAGKELVGKKYHPPFDYFKEALHKHKTHAWRVYAAPYVTLEDGTGIVHLAPAFGAEDLELAQKEKIPLIHHVTEEGKFVAAVVDFAHLAVKPKGRHMETDAKIVEHLENRGLLFKQEKISHSYPHCWRCDTPLLNWASNSWFVKVSSIKHKLQAENKKVAWVPEHVGKGRFQNGLASAPDWAISRSRYWGAPIPVWRNTKTKEIKAVGSVEELLKLVRRSGNTYFVMRHGEASSNVSNTLDFEGRTDNHLTEKGKKDVAQAAEMLAKKTNIDMVVYSPLVRTHETAEIIKKTFGLRDSAVMADERLREYNPNETPLELRRRVGEVLFDIERRYSGKKILMVTHEAPVRLMREVAARQPLNSSKKDGESLKTAEIQEFEFTLFPHNDDYNVDLHRPYIDEVPLGDSMRGEWKRVLDVFDCWFESGSMPFASKHYPFDKKVFNPKRALGLFPKGYPADFIAEGLDQTRGWFYSLIVLGTALFGKSPYKNVIVNGFVQAQDGQKMSKRLKNYPDPMDVVEKFGADALRYYILSSSLVQAEDLNFALRGVEEVSKKLLMRLDNVRSFYDLYTPTQESLAKSVAEPKTEVRDLAKDSHKTLSQTQHVLDAWILSRLGELVRDTTAGFEKYELDMATRPLAGFIDDLSTWYLRRSRDRFKTDGANKAQALATLHHVLFTVSHVMAPIMPFFAEDLFKRVRNEDDAESVHLSNWPVAPAINAQLLKDMQMVRLVCSHALEVREKAGMKIRQPLAMLKAKQLPVDPALRALIADELNVKEVLEDATQTESVWLDTNLTQELKEEGMVRDLLRRIQDWRKEQKLQMNDRPSYTLEVTPEEKAVAEKNKSKLIEQTGLATLTIMLKQTVDA